MLAVRLAFPGPLRSRWRQGAIRESLLRRNPAMHNRKDPRRAQSASAGDPVLSKLKSQNFSAARS